MSRSCVECNMDNNCDLQRSGYRSCSRGSAKTREQKIKDIDILKERYEKELIEDEYGWHNPDDKLPEENQDCVIEVEYTNELNIIDKRYEQYEVKFVGRYWIGNIIPMPGCNNKVTKWRVK